MMNKLVIYGVLMAVMLLEARTEESLFEQDLGDQFKIDASTRGLQKVNLRCGADSMRVELKTEEDFDGVMYTRGSFYKQSEPCFVKPKRAGKTLEMKFNLDQCQTINNGEIYSNIVVVQHDPDLVTPGDAAFAVECDFRKPRGVTVNAEIQARDSEGDTVTFIPSQFTNKTAQEKRVKGSVETVEISSNRIEL
ncbi:hypothetical protein quinque_002034 [Culex quinquefasciatus]